MMSYSRPQSLFLRFLAPLLLAALPAFAGSTMNCVIVGNSNHFGWKNTDDYWSGNPAEQWLFFGYADAHYSSPADFLADDLNGSEWPITMPLLKNTDSLLAVYTGHWDNRTGRNWLAWKRDMDSAIVVVRDSTGNPAVFVGLYAKFGHKDTVTWDGSRYSYPGTFTEREYDTLKHFIDISRFSGQCFLNDHYQWALLIKKHYWGNTQAIPANKAAYFTPIHYQKDGTAHYNGLGLQIQMYTTYCQLYNRPPWALASRANANDLAYDGTTGHNQSSPEHLAFSKAVAWCGYQHAGQDGYRLCEKQGKPLLRETSMEILLSNGPAIDLNDTTRISIRSVYNDGSRDTNFYALYRSLDTNIVAVSYYGRILGIAPGVGHVEILRGRLLDTVEITVRGGTAERFDSVRISNVPLLCRPGHDFSFLGYRGGASQSVEGSSFLSVVVSDPGRFTVNNAGLMTRTGLLTSARGVRLVITYDPGGVNERKDTAIFDLPNEPGNYIRLNFQATDTFAWNGWFNDSGAPAAAGCDWGWTRGSFEREENPAGWAAGGNGLVLSGVAPAAGATDTLVLRPDWITADGVFTLKASMGHPFSRNRLQRLVLHNQSRATNTWYLDTLLEFTNNEAVPCSAVVHHHFEYGGEGLKLLVTGMINYIVVKDSNSCPVDSIIGRGAWADRDYSENRFCPGSMAAGGSFAISPESPEWRVRPNPFNPSTLLSGYSAGRAIEIRVCSLDGRLLRSLKAAAPKGRYSRVLGFEGLPAGVYLVRVHDGVRVATIRAVYLK